MVHVPRWQIFAVIAVLLLGLAYAAPNIMSRQFAEDLPSWIPHEKINLGLDLQGGSSVLMQVDLDEVFEEQLDNLMDAVRQELRSGRIGYTNLGREGETVSFQLRDPAAEQQVRERLRNLGDDLLVTVSGDTNFSVRYTDAAIMERRQNVVNQVIEIVRIRIDETGTREPSVQRQGEDRVLIQLPGVGDPERVKDLIGRSISMGASMRGPDGSSRK